MPQFLYNTPLQERRAKILDDSSTLAKGVDGDFIAPDSLLQEVDVFIFLHIFLVETGSYPETFETTMQVVNLVEAPVPILGRYDDSFLELPKDVLTTVCSDLDGDAYKLHYILLVLMMYSQNDKSNDMSCALRITQLKGIIS